MLAHVDADPARGAKGGRLAKMATGIDLELVAIEPGCAVLRMEPALEPPAGETLELFDVLERTTVQIVRDIGDEQRGIARNEVVRQFLESLPPLARQSYVASRNGKELARSDFAVMHLPPPEQPLPGLVRLRGRVVGVGFEVGKEYVDLQVDSRKLSCDADGVQVESALASRKDEVEAMALRRGGQQRLLWIRPAAAPLVAAEPEERLSRQMTRWRGVLAKLAQ